jgi:hypothetical protein
MLIEFVLAAEFFDTLTDFTGCLLYELIECNLGIWTER